MSIQNTELNISDFKHIELAHALPNFNRNYFTDEKSIVSYRAKYNNIGLYRSAYWYNNIENVYESALFSDLYFDFDSEDDIDKAREDLLFVIWKMHLKNGFSLPMEAFRIYFSGKKGFHLVIPHEYIGIKPHYQLDKLFKWIAMEMYEQSIHETVDLVVYEKRRLFRLENSKHQETNLYKVPITYEEANLPIEDILKIASSPRLLKYPMPELVPQARREYERFSREMVEEEKRRAERWKNRPARKPFEEGEMPSYVKTLIDGGPQKGYRNETAAALSSYWFQQSLSEDEILERLLEWNGGSLPEREIKSTMRSVLKRGLTYGRKRLKALAEQDMTILNPKPERRGTLPPWKKTTKD